MYQDMCNDCYESGFKDGRRNTILELTEILKSELHKFIINNNVIYVNDVVNIMEQVKQNVLCEETHSSQSTKTHSR